MCMFYLLQWTVGKYSIYGAEISSLPSALFCLIKHPVTISV